MKTRTLFHFDPSASSLAATPGDELRLASQDLIVSCQGLVRSIAWKIYKRLPTWIDLEDLVADGNLGLAQAARDFEALRGVQFTTYAYNRVRGAIFKGLERNGWFSPRAYHANEYENRPMASDEATATPPADASSENRDSASSPPSVVERRVECIAADETTPCPASAAMTKELHHSLHDLIETLPADARNLIRARYFEQVTLQEAAKRLGISKPWATRLHARALGRLARGLRCAGVVGRSEGRIDHEPDFRRRR